MIGIMWDNVMLDGPRMKIPKRLCGMDPCFDRLSHDAKPGSCADRQKPDLGIGLYQ